MLRSDESELEVKDEVVDGAGDRADLTEVTEFDEVFDNEDIVHVLLQIQVSLEMMNKS